MAAAHDDETPQSVIDEVDMARYTKFFETIKGMLPDGQYCLQYYFVKRDELPLLKKQLDEKQKENKDDNNFIMKLAEQKKIDDYGYSENRTSLPVPEEYIKYKQIEKEFADLLIKQLILPHDIKHTDLERRLIIISDKDEDVFNKPAPILHREFEPSQDKFTYLVLYCNKIKNCDSDTSGTGIGFIDKAGKKQYFILPMVEGLILVLRDKCIAHHTPNITPKDKGNPIYRELIRQYLGTVFEESIAPSLHTPEGIEGFEKLIKSGDVNIVKSREEYLTKPGDSIIKKKVSPPPVIDGGYKYHQYWIHYCY